ncbi:MAG: nucleoside-diphosphate kinase [Candidatus Omnitrophota bacterium]
MIEATLVLIKPDGLKKSLTGNILTRLSETKLDIVAARVTNVSVDIAKAHYRALAEKPFFAELIKYIQGEFHDKRKVMAMVYCGEGAIDKIRKIAGATNPEEADSVSIRGQYGRITTKGVYENVIHASANQADAEREIKLWFNPSEIIVDLYPTKQVESVNRERVWA